ncbi:hypothetical protein AB4Z09_25925 [Rhodococcus sp. TAF43]|uniref:hypothetical protein n=1 Tax=unclassified Rhodococcus (in: high G+C Gram-positive bacteria) TaxID=192944 RepID=UPI000E0A180A|nr:MULTISPECIES: hypothetical protein [unclassified Rhodococcus (in: high G+C Gram-positive bacteria)]QKT11892.1 hypothetical protein HUN07_15225 [Rhodococcus sp. W8901]RDI21077.1 hypothetical protein DEU38_11518 [Rhodococcus sp. AG1013]
MLIHPTLRMQSWGFTIGSLLFALGSAPVLAPALGTATANTAFFVGSWFFTYAAFIQLVLSGAATTTDTDTGKPAIRAEWLAAATQFLGTVLFNISTGAALHAHTIAGEKHLVWTPNAEGSIAFLISSYLAILMLVRAKNYWAPRSLDWQSAWFNALGSLAFGLSAAGAFITQSGSVEDASLANAGTFVGALFFFAASVIFLGKPRRPAPEPVESL